MTTYSYVPAVKERERRGGGEGRGEGSGWWGIKGASQPCGGVGVPDEQGEGEGMAA